MSSKTKTSAMKEDGKPARVPKLRFPEFRGAEGWEPKTLAEICLQITNGKANAQDHEEDGNYPLFDRSAVIKKSSEFMFDAEAVILPGEGMRFVPKYFQGKFNLHQRAYAFMNVRRISRSTQSSPVPSTRMISFISRSLTPRSALPYSREGRRYPSSTRVCSLRCGSSSPSFPNNNASHRV